MKLFGRSEHNITPPVRSLPGGFDGHVSQFPSFTSLRFCVNSSFKPICTQPFDTPRIHVNVLFTRLMLEDTAAARLRCSSISLEDGADEARLDGESIGFCKSGICFPSRWQFDPGTTLALTLEVCGTGERAHAQGVVAGCEPAGERLWSVTVVFLDIPAAMAKLPDSEFEIRGDFSGPRLR